MGKRNGKKGPNEIADELAGILSGDIPAGKVDVSHVTLPKPKPKPKSKPKKVEPKTKSKARIEDYQKGTWYKGWITHVSDDGEYGFASFPGGKPDVFIGGKFMSPKGDIPLHMEQRVEVIVKYNFRRRKYFAIDLKCV